MATKKVWETPKAFVEEFTPNEYVSACYKLACSVGPHGNSPTFGNHWNGSEYGGVSHSKMGTAGTCGDASANRVITDTGAEQIVQEHNNQQGWISGEIDYIIDVEEDGFGPGDIVYWHTFSGNKDRRWNHWGYVEETDPNHPNHS